MAKSFHASPDSMLKLEPRAVLKDIATRFVLGAVEFIHLVCEVFFCLSILLLYVSGLIARG